MKLRGHSLGYLGIGRFLQIMLASCYDLVGEGEGERFGRRIFPRLLQRAHVPSSLITYKNLMQGCWGHRGDEREASCAIRQPMSSYVLGNYRLYHEGYVQRDNRAMRMIQSRAASIYMSLSICSESSRSSSSSSSSSSFFCASCSAKNA